MTTWKTVKFGDVVRQVKDKVDPKQSGLVRYIAGEHMDTDNLHIRHWGTIGDNYLGPAFHMRFKPGQVLYGSRRTYLRKVAFADFEGITANTTYVLESKDPDVLLPELLPFIMQTDSFNEHSIKQSKGSVNPYINFSDIDWYEFPLPPLDEQRRIADLLWAVDDYLTQLSESLVKLEYIRKSFLFEKFNQLMKRKEKLVKISQAGEVLMGRQLSPKYTKNISPKPYLRVANVFDGYLDLSDVKSMDFNITESQKFLLKFGDVLLNEGQARELVGRSCIYRDEIPNCCFQNTLLRFRPKLTSSEYAHYFFQYCQYSGRFVEKAKQTTSIAHLGSGRFLEMSFPVPESLEEKEIVGSLNEINRSMTQLSETKSRAQVMKAEILKKNF